MPTKTIRGINYQIRPSLSTMFNPSTTRTTEWHPTPGSTKGWPGCPGCTR